MFETKESLNLRKHMPDFSMLISKANWTHVPKSHSGYPKHSYIFFLASPCATKNIFFYLKCLFSHIYTLLSTTFVNIESHSIISVHKYHSNLVTSLFIAGWVRITSKYFYFRTSFDTGFSRKQITNQLFLWFPWGYQP